MFIFVYLVILFCWSYILFIILYRFISLLWVVGSKSIKEYWMMSVFNKRREFFRFILVAIVFGGMPISGGARSKIYAAVVGGFSYIILNNILDLLIDSTSGYGITQIVSAVFFLVVVYVASANYRSQMLPR